MVELVDTLALGASASNGLGVRLSLWAPKSGGYSTERIRRIRLLSSAQIISAGRLARLRPRDGAPLI